MCFSNIIFLLLADSINTPAITSGTIEAVLVMCMSEHQSYYNVDYIILPPGGGSLSAGV